MNRRVVIVGIVALVLVVSAISIGRGLHPALASRTNADSSVSASQPMAVAPEVTPATAVTAVPEAAAPAPAPEAPAARPAAPQASVAGGAVTDIDPHKALGTKNAPITVEVFSDFQCPACKTLFLTVNQKLITNYVDTNKVYLIHRDFPLPMHAYSKVAARYARAAAHLGKGDAVEQALFQNQERWEQSGDVDGIVAGVLSAGEMTKVRALVKGGTLDASIDKDTALGQGYHVNQTPTTIIHSKGQTYPVVGIVSYDVLKSFLDQLLSQK